MTSAGPLLALALIFLCSWTSTAQAQPRVPRIGVLSIATDPARPLVSQWVAFLDGLRAFGYDRLPAIYTTREFVELGGLMAYGPSFVDLFRRAPAFVDKILKGVRPADLPVEQPARFELVLNLRTAMTLGLTIPPTLLARAADVLQ